MHCLAFTERFAVFLVLPPTGEAGRTAEGTEAGEAGSAVAPRWQAAVRASTCTCFLPAMALSLWLRDLQACLLWWMLARKHLVFGMSGVQEKCLLAGGFTVFLTAKRAQEQAVSSLKRWPCWISHPRLLLAQSGLLAGDEDHLTICKCPGSCESSKSPQTHSLVCHVL